MASIDSTGSGSGGGGDDLARVVLWIDTGVTYDP
jgi:hypothetical protein